LLKANIKTACWPEYCWFQTVKNLINDIFSLKDPASFRQLALEIMCRQADYNEVYRQYLAGLDIHPRSVRQLENIPFLPIEFFKSRIVVNGELNEKMRIFTSSGTTGSESRHYVTDISVYDKSFRSGFEHFYGDITDYCVLALLPSYLEREGSSLVYMVDDLISRSAHPESGFFLHNHEELAEKLKRLDSEGQKVLLIGVTYALLDLVEKERFSLKNAIIMETGGMKGKRKEMIREELHDILCEGFGVKEIHSEYGMTELLSQAYSKGSGRFFCPPWMKILIRDVNDPFTFLPEGRTGGIDIIDLANANSCSFIATQDLGKIHPDGSFEVLGRFDNSDIRGCNLMVE
jgi:phenylacetate-coenzyme A ligase PaaK-like adenylate-forming protein